MRTLKPVKNSGWKLAANHNWIAFNQSYFWDGEVLGRKNIGVWFIQSKSFEGVLDPNPNRNLPVLCMIREVANNQISGGYTSKEPLICIAFCNYTVDIQGHHQVWQAWRGGPRTPSRTTDANLDCVCLLKAHSFLLLQKLWDLLYDRRPVKKRQPGVSEYSFGALYSLPVPTPTWRRSRLWCGTAWTRTWSWPAPPATTTTQTEGAEGTAETAPAQPPVSHHTSLKFPKKKNWWTSIELRCWLSSNSVDWASFS